MHEDALIHAFDKDRGLAYNTVYRLYAGLEKYK